jgi:hypothetical protein
LVLLDHLQRRARRCGECTHAGTKSEPTFCRCDISVSQDWTACGGTVLRCQKWLIANCDD